MMDIEPRHYIGGQGVYTRPQIDEVKINIIEKVLEICETHPDEFVWSIIPLIKELL